MKRLVVLVFALIATSLTACKPAIREGVFACTANRDCPQSMVCRSDRFCWSTLVGGSDATSTADARPRRDSGPRLDGTEPDDTGDEDVPSGEDASEDASEDAEPAATPRATQQRITTPSSPMHRPFPTRATMAAW